MILIINNEIKIQGKPEECIDFLKRYREEFKEEEPTNILEEKPTPLDNWLHTYTPSKVPGVTYTNNGCEDCLYYIQMKDNPRLIVGDTPCTWCPKMQPYCTSGGSSLQFKVTATDSVLTDPLDIN